MTSQEAFFGNKKMEEKLACKKNNSLTGCGSYKQG